MGQISKFMRRLITIARGWTVMVAWDDRIITHRATSYRDALAWMACYPAQASVTITQHWSLVCKRYGQAITH